MTHTKRDIPADVLMQQVEEMVLAGRHTQAESRLRGLLDQHPGHIAGSLLAARLAMVRRDVQLASVVLRAALEHHPEETELSIQLALALAASGCLAEASLPLEASVARRPGNPQAWLILSMIRDRLGNAAGGLQAAYRAVTRAQRAGAWLNEASTPPELLAPVGRAIERVRLGRRDLFLGSFAELRAQHGGDALKRMDRALSGYLKDLDMPPPDPRQRPKFFYFPDLPSTPYHSPELQPWASKLTAAFPEIRAEAQTVIKEDHRALPDFIPNQAAQAPGQYLGGAAAHPAWQAFFFYRHGERYNDNHARCPVTSSVLESIELCRIAEQAPEICFSVLNPQTHIKPHYGVTNTRLVMHLPLIVPKGCALNVINGGEHEWEEGRLVMFDDTFQHEAWNRSNDTRVILLMDCWNPYLTPVERQACAQLVEMISSLKPKTGNSQQAA